MSLEELKNDWESIDASKDHQSISRERIDAVLSSKGHSIVNRILIFEVLLILALLYFTTLVTFTFNALEIFYLEVIAIFSIGIMALMIAVTFIKLMRNYQIRFINHSHAKALKKLAQQNIQSQKFYLLNFITGFILFVFVSILCIKAYNEFDLIQSQTFWFTIIPTSFVVMFFGNRWIRNSYSKVIKESKDLIKELE